jgi:hypothetical protein
MHQQSRRVGAPQRARYYTIRLMPLWIWALGGLAAKALELLGRSSGGLRW